MPLTPVAASVRIAMPTFSARAVTLTGIVALHRLPTAPAQSTLKLMVQFTAFVATAQFELSTMPLPLALLIEAGLVVSQATNAASTRLSVAAMPAAVLAVETV